MTRIDKLLAKIRENPRNWRIEDLIAIAKHKGATMRNPRGSHVVFTHDSIEEVVSIPAHKPIKPVYIRQFLVFMDAIQEKK